MFAQLAAYYRLLDALVPALGEEPALRPTAPGPEGNGPAAPRRYGERVTRVVALLHDSLDDRWTLDALAREVGLSRAHLVRGFHAETGTSPMAYLRCARAERMAHLLRTTDLGVAAVGRAVGWPDPSHASRRFTAHWRVSPAAYRAGLGMAPGSAGPNGGQLVRDVGRWGPM